MTEPNLWAAVAARADNPIVFGLILAAAVYLFVSKRLAEIKGTFAWVGGAARWWNDRQKRRVERDRELFLAQHAADTERSDVRVTDLTTQVAYLENELRDARKELREANERHDRELAAMRDELRAARTQLSETLDQLAGIRRDVGAVHHKIDHPEEA